MKRISVICMFVISIFTQSCDHGIGLYVRNRTSDTLSLEIIYIEQADFDTLEFVKMTLDSVGIKELNHKLFFSKIVVTQIDSLIYEFKSPPKSTVYIEPIYFGTNITRVIVDQQDTVVTTDIEIDKLKQLGLVEKKHVSTGWAKYILNIDKDLREKLNELIP